ncbi:HD domain-containing protein, partial [Synechococcus sp. AH-551-G15]|nr:HD domain-containing protein [Synechococcus sp. AH-551-G15]
FSHWILDLMEKPKETPLRLIIQLPLRTLVSQTEKRVKEMVERAGLDIDVYVLQGGQVEDDFIHEPDKPCVIVGTLDQIVSRQLMRPYCASRWSAPLHFNSTNNNVRIVVDETQLQDLAYPTAVRLQEFYQKFGGFHPRQLVLCSATLNSDPIKNLDFGVIEVGEDDKTHPHFSKKFCREKKLQLLEPMEPEELASLVNEKHSPDTLTLVVCNTVKRAQAVLSDISHPKLLLTSRFRRGDRETIEASLQGFRGVVVATQVVEAGVDLDARLLVSDLCPWSSAVQRAGRAGRNGTYSECDVVFINTNQPLPYDNQVMRQCWDHLQTLSNFNISTVLENQLFEPVAPCSLTEKVFLTELCDNSPNNVEPPTAPFIREVDDGNVFVAWREDPNKDMRFVEKHEICPVPWSEVTRSVAEVWLINEDSEWVKTPLQRNSQIPVGSCVVIESKLGCYHPDFGWLSGFGLFVPELPSRKDGNRQAFPLSEPLNLNQHLIETRDFVSQIMQSIHFSDEELVSLVSRAGFLHDIGKASDDFQWFIQNGNPQEGVQLAKGQTNKKHRTPGLRHEAHSAMACLSMDEELLVTYLVMSHHGKIRTSFRGFDWQDEVPGRIHGVASGDVLPSVPGVSPEVTIKLPNDYGVKWSDIYHYCLDEYGIFKLVEMESLVRNGDVRSSRLHQIALAD